MNCVNRVKLDGQGQRLKGVNFYRYVYREDITASKATSPSATNTYPSLCLSDIGKQALLTTYVLLNKPAEKESGYRYVFSTEYIGQKCITQSFSKTT